MDTGTELSMNIRVNGDTLTLPDSSTLADLISLQGLGGRRIAIERNGEIVPRSQHASCLLADGDQLEIVHAIGGG